MGHAEQTKKLRQWTKASRVLTHLDRVLYNIRKFVLLVEVFSKAAPILALFYRQITDIQFQIFYKIAINLHCQKFSVVCKESGSDRRGRATIGRYNFFRHFATPLGKICFNT